MRAAAGIALSTALALSAPGAAWCDMSGGMMGTMNPTTSGADTMPFDPQQGRLSGEEILNTYNRGITALNAGEWKKAAVQFRIVTDNLPGSADAWNYMGYAERRAGAAKRSEAAYKKALKINPNHTGANEYYGELLVELNRMAEAEQRLAVLKACCAAGPQVGHLEAFIAQAMAAPVSSAAKPSVGY